MAPIDTITANAYSITSANNIDVRYKCLMRVCARKLIEFTRFIVQLTGMTHKIVGVNPFSVADSCQIMLLHQINVVILCEFHNFIWCRLH